MSTIDFADEDVVWVSHNLYVKTPQALETVLTKLAEIGYNVKDGRKDEYSLERATPEQMEQNGWSLWFASLDIRYAKCGSCSAYITALGCQVHGATCSECGAVIYRKFVDGSTMRFEFVSDDCGWFSPELRLKVRRWDTDEGFLYFYTDFQESGLSTVTGEKAENYMAQHTDKWELVNEDGLALFKIHYPLATSGWITKDSVINPRDTWGDEQNHRIVKLWEGKEYSEYGRLPVPDMISIYESWHWAPLEPSPTLHERLFSAINQVSRKDYWYQDGRPAFSRTTYELMGVFVRHFTSLDADEWDRRSRNFRLDGPGGIDDVANFCHPNPEVVDEPNFGNTLVALGKAFGGEPLTAREHEAALIGAADDPFFGYRRKSRS